MYRIVSFFLLCSMIIHTSQPPLYIYDCMQAGIVAAISSIASSLSYAPFHYAQNRCIQQLPIDLKRMHHCLRGYHILLCNNLPTIALQMMAYKALQNYIHCSQDMENNLYQKKTVCAAAFAGMISAPFTNATQLLMLHKQNTGLPTLTILNTFPHSYRSLGRGLAPTTLQGICFITTYTNGLPLLKNKINHRCSNNTIAFISSALLSALFLTITTQPLKVMAIKLHADVDKKLYKGMFDVALKTMKQNGIHDIYKAWQWRTLGNSIAIPMFTMVQNALNNLK